MAIPTFLYGFGILPTFSIWFLAFIAWFCVSIRVLAVLAIMGSDKEFKRGEPSAVQLASIMHLVSVFATVTLFWASFTITGWALAISSVITFLIFARINFFPAKAEE